MVSRCRAHPMHTAFFSPRNRFFKLFPPPSLLAAPFAAVWFSPGSLILVEFSTGSHGLYLSRYAKKILAPGILSAGAVADEAKLTAALRELAVECRLSRIRFVLPDEKIYLFTTDVPMLPAGETRDNISFQIEENVPLSLEECIFDYTLIPEESMRGIRAPRQAAVAVIEKTILEAYVRAARAAGLSLLSVEAERQAMTRSVIPSQSTESQLVVHMGRDCSSIHIVARGLVQYSSCVDIGESSLDQALMKTFPGSTAESIAEMKRAHSFTGAPKEKEFVSALVGGIAALQDEINRRYLYWHSREEVEAAAHPPIKSVMLSGSPAVLKGLAEHLSEGLRLPVMVADPWINVGSSGTRTPSLTLQDALSVAPAIGGALRGSDIPSYA